MKEYNFLLKKDGWLILLLIIVHTVCWFALKPIAPQSDPECYFIYAKRILQHQYVFNYGIGDHRFGVIIPLAGFISLFGENPYVISLWPLLCSLMTIILVYFFVRKNTDWMTAFTAGLLLSINLIQIIYSTVVYADIIVSLFFLWCVYFIYTGRKEPDKWLKNSLLYTLFFAFGLISKESIILIIPFIVFIFWRDLKHKRPYAFQQAIGVFFVLFILLFFAVSKLLTDDFIFFYRSFKKYDFAPLPDVTSFLKRVSYEPFLWLNSQYGFIFLFIFSFPAFIAGLNKKDDFSSIESFTALYFIFLLMTLWWGTCSIIHLSALPILDRRWMMLIAPLCILSTFTIQKIVENKNSKNDFYFLLSSLSVLSVINWLIFSAQRGKLFLLFAVMLLLQELLSKYLRIKNELRIALIVLPFIILAIHFLRNNSNYVVQAVQ